MEEHALRLLALGASRLGKSTRACHQGDAYEWN